MPGINPIDSNNYQQILQIQQNAPEVSPPQGPLNVPQGQPLQLEQIWAQFFQPDPQIPDDSDTSDDLDIPEDFEVQQVHPHSPITWKGKCVTELKGIVGNLMMGMVLKFVIDEGPGAAFDFTTVSQNALISSIAIGIIHFFGREEDVKTMPTGSLITALLGSVVGKGVGTGVGAAAAVGAVAGGFIHRRFS